MALAQYLPYLRRVLIKGGLPVQMIFFVTNRCNLKCAHCFFWEELNVKTDELSVDEVGRIFSSIPNLLTLSLTGGEPFLRTDLVDLVRAISSRTRVSHLSLFSNGLTPERVAGRLAEILSSCPIGHLSFGTSLDGLGADHDEVRGLAGAFDRTVETIGLVVSLKRKFPNLTVGVVTTFSAKTQHNLKAITELVVDKLGADDHTITLVRGAPKDPRVKELDIGLYEQFFRDKRERLKRSSGRGGLPGAIITARELLGSTIISTVYRENRMVVPCYGGALTAVLRENGDVYPCEMLDEKIGNIREFDYDLRKLWMTRRADEVRRLIRETDCFCTWECALTPNILFNPRNYGALFREMVNL